MTEGEASWAESAIEGACRRAREWYQSLAPFDPRVFVGKGEVIGHKHAAILSERDCVIAFARFLEQEGVPGNAIHHEVPISRWLFDAPHPAATMMTTAQRRRRIDLVLVKQDHLLAADLPATQPGGFQFEAFLEFGYLSDYWTVAGARVFGAGVAKDRDKVQKDVEKIGLHLAAGACRLGYVVVFEDADSGFADDFVREADANHHGCRIHFIRGRDDG